MGWTNAHLYQFNVGEQVIADTRLVDDELGPVTDVKGVMVTQVFSHVGNTITYEYDFGDGWMHHFELVEISTPRSMRCYLRSLGVRTHVHLKIVVVPMDIKN